MTQRKKTTGKKDTLAAERLELKNARNQKRRLKLATAVERVAQVLRDKDISTQAIRIRMPNVFGGATLVGGAGLTFLDWDSDPTDAAADSDPTDIWADVDSSDRIHDMDPTDPL